MMRRLNSTLCSRSACRTVALAVLVLLGLNCGQPKHVSPTPRAENGVLDLRKWDLKQTGIVNLDGRWKVLENRFVDASDFGAVRTTAPVPGKRVDGFATYYLRVLLPPGREGTPLEMRFPTLAAAVEVKTNGHAIWKVGKPGKTRDEHISHYRTGTIQLPPLKGNVLEITMRISYFGSRTGGPWKSIQLGHAQDILAADVRDLALDIFLCGSIFVMGLYHLGLFLTNRRDKSSLIFAVFCLVCFARLIVNSQFLIGRLAPDFPWGISHRVSYISFYIAIPLFVTFLCTVFHDPRERLLNYFAWPVPLLATLFVLLTPTYVYPQSLTAYQIYSLPWVLVVGALWVRAIRRKEAGARTSSVAGLIFVATVIIDLVRSNAGLGGIDLMFPGLFIFILAQSYVLSVKVSRVFTSRRRLSHELEAKANQLSQTNRAFARFVPMTFFAQLGKTDVREIKLGDQTQADMQLLFSDIRSFTEISEGMSPRENFEFINSYLRRVTPLILRNEGFVEKYIGDAIMALFPGGSDNTLRAAIDMQGEIRDFNRRRLKKGYVPIQAGVGLHAGTLMLGTIGDRDRMDGTVISIAVDVVQRIEALTKVFGADILASEAVMNVPGMTGAYHSRMVGKIGTSDTSESIRLYEIFNGRPEHVIELFMTTKPAFEEGIHAFERREWRHGAAAMQHVLEQDPGDLAAKYYLEKLESRRTRA